MRPAAISKARFRAGLPGRMTTALSIAIKNSMAGAAAMDAALSNGSKAIDNRRPDMVGMQKHQERMALLDPGHLEAKAAQLGYGDMVVVNQPKIPSQNGPLLPPGPDVVVATVEKKKRGRKKKEVVVATVAPSGDVVPAVAVVATAAAADFPAFVEHWARHTKHKKGLTVFDYLQKQYTSGQVYDAGRKRWRRQL